MAARAGPPTGRYAPPAGAARRGRRTGNRVHDPAPALTGRARAAWERIAPGNLDRLVLPGCPGFRCQPTACDALCCRDPYLAPLTAREVGGLCGRGFVPATFVATLGDPHGRHLPLALAGRPLYLQKTAGGASPSLGAPRGCPVYTDRPGGCRAYPHTLLFAALSGERLVGDAAAALRASAVRIAAGGGPGRASLIPLIT